MAVVLIVLLVVMAIVATCLGASHSEQAVKDNLDRQLDQNKYEETGDDPGFGVERGIIILMFVAGSAILVVTAFLFDLVPLTAIWKGAILTSPIVIGMFYWLMSENDQLDWGEMALWLVIALAMGIGGTLFPVVCVGLWWVYLAICLVIWAWSFTAEALYKIYG